MYLIFLTFRIAPDTAPDIFAENIEALELQFFALKLIPRLIRVLVVLRTCDTRVSVSMIKINFKSSPLFLFQIQLSDLSSCAQRNW